MGFKKLFAYGRKLNLHIMCIAHHMGIGDEDWISIHVWHTRKSGGPTSACELHILWLLIRLKPVHFSRNGLDSNDAVGYVLELAREVSFSPCDLVTMRSFRAGSCGHLRRS